MSAPYSPVIIIGMHRSGTSMITNLLEALGLFMGEKKDQYEEAVFFHSINLWFVHQSNAHWDNPEPVHRLIENQDIRSLVTDYINRYLLHSPRTIAFLGLSKYLKYGTLFNLDIPWAWKSPLNTFTLPLWLDLFPEAKVIHIYRHGVDVVQSLRQRGRQAMRRTPLQQLYYNLKFIHWIVPKPGRFIESLRCDSLEGGLSLWEEYLSEARHHVHQLQGRALEIRYEDFLSSPSPALKELAGFCGLRAQDAAIEQAVARVRSERAYAYRKDPELRAFADRMEGRLMAQSY